MYTQFNTADRPATPEMLRTMGALERTQRHLMDLLDAAEGSLAQKATFIEDRQRSMRQDMFVQQMVVSKGLSFTTRGGEGNLCTSNIRLGYMPMDKGYTA